MKKSVIGNEIIGHIQIVARRKEINVESGDLIFISPSNKAKGRTKNRLREHGADGFVVQKVSTSASCLDSRPAVLLKSISKTASGGEQWHGWLALEEVEISL